MRVALTGTPGTGKTTVGRALGDDPLPVVHLGALIEASGLIADYDPVRDTNVVDLEALAAAVADRDEAVFESHLAHRLPVDLAVVLRCHPVALVERLRGKGVAERSVWENAEAEALDVILAEAVDALGPERVVEIDTTERAVEAVASDVRAAIAGDLGPRSGIVDFTEWL